MLNINKNQVQIDQKVKVCKPLYFDTGRRPAYLMDYNYNNNPSLPLGTILTIKTKPDANSHLIVTDDNGKEYGTWWSTIKSTTELGEFVNEGSEVIEYKIYLKGVDIKKKKFKDIGKVKASLMSAMGYTDKFTTIAKNYYDRCPENQDTMDYYYETYYNQLTRADFHNIEIYEWKNRKKGNKVDFDAVAFWDELMKYIAVSAQFGSAAREVYKKTRETHSVIVVYVPDEYRQSNNRYWDYRSLTESDVIKIALKNSGVKGSVKSTKNGKTAIAFTEKGDAMKVIRLLPKETFYILDMNGEELEEKTELFILNQSRAEKLRNLMQIVNK